MGLKNFRFKSNFEISKLNLKFRINSNRFSRDRSFWHHSTSEWLISFTLLHVFDFRHDSLTIFDGGTNTSPKLGNPYCGDSLPSSQISSRNHLFIYFHSDRLNTGTGFKLEYNATSKNPNKIDNFKIVFVIRLPVKKPIIFLTLDVVLFIFLY